MEWMRASGRDEEYIRDQVRFLDKYMRPIRSPADVVAMFAECKRSKDHLNKAFRNLLKFYRKIMGYPKSFIEDLKEAIRSLRTDLKEAIRSHTEAIRKPHGAYYFLELGWVRETKATFIACLPDFIYDMIIAFRESGEKLTWNGARQFRKKRMPHIETPGSMRDFCYNKLLELGMPESAADFLNGRGPRRIGGKHYMDKIRQIKAFYPRYLAYLKELKARAEQD